MTSRGERSTGLAPIRMDGFDLARLADLGVGGQGATGSRAEDRHRFWVSSQRSINSNRREIMEVSFGAERMVNHLAFKVGRFPLVLEVEYLDANGKWQAVTYAKSSRRRRHRRGPRRRIKREPVRLVISESVPGRVNSAQARRQHPQHFGKAHWLDESWKVTPVRTRKIRFIFVRNDRGQPPRNHHGHRVPYSIALRHLTIGYRVLAPDDIPNTTPDQPWWASSQDILGSQIVYSTYNQPAERVIDGDLLTYWRSEPQPFPFAVVNMYLDLRDATGVAPVVDRFWVDPITTGVMCNLYHSDSVLTGDFDGLSDPVPYQFRTEVSTPTISRDAQTLRPTSLNLHPDTQRGIAVSDLYTRMRYDRPWWAGADLTAISGTEDTEERPILTLGTTRVVQEGTDLKVIAQSGAEAVIALDPDLHGSGTRYRLVVSYHPEDENTARDAYLRLTYAIEGFDAVVEEVGVTLADASGSISVGLHPDPESTDTAAIRVHGLVVKSEALIPEIEQWFIEEGEAFVSDPDTAYEDRGTSANSRIRMHPLFVGVNNPFGVVGGAGDRFGEMEWTPILRDYTLRQGYMHLPPTRAGYWKFEMTGLLPQIYENFVPIDREVLVFPPDVVAAHQQAEGLADENSAPSGVETAGGMARAVAYADVLEAVRRAPPPADATEVLVVKDPVQAAQIASNGWIWQYQPWHVGSSAPQFMGTQVHRYESLRVRHTTKVAYFAGLREVRPFRVDYTYDDDTPEYVEHLLDTAFLDLTQTTGVEVDPGGIRATSSYAEIVSQPLLSYRLVRAIQFAAQETDSVQVLTDPDFIADHLDFWEPYGDATLHRLGPHDVIVSRGWFLNTYGDLEAKYATYGDMDGTLYALLEGNNQISGYAEGGITSETYTPSGAGKVMGVVTVSSSTAMAAPVVVELVSSYDDRVLASASKRLQPGETSTLSVPYAPGALLDRRTYGDLETLVSDPTTYEELEAYRFFELETESSIYTDLYVRVRQQGPTEDSFHVHRVAIYDSPIAWFFSNDDGESWWQAIDVENDPHAVLTFPVSLTPEEPGTGRTLRWKAVLYRENAVLSALHIRPWYGTRERTVARAHGLDSLGPNRSMRDFLPATHQHPMWQFRDNPIEHVYDPPSKVLPFWRNLAINPSAEYFDPGTEMPTPNAVFGPGFPTITKTVENPGSSWRTTVTLPVEVHGTVPAGNWRIMLLYYDLRPGTPTSDLGVPGPPPLRSGWPNGANSGVIATLSDGVLNATVVVTPESAYGTMDQHDIVGVQLWHDGMDPGAFVDTLPQVTNGDTGTNVEEIGYYYFGEKVAVTDDDRDEPYPLTGSPASLPGWSGESGEIETFGGTP